MTPKLQLSLRRLAIKMASWLECSMPRCLACLAYTMQATQQQRLLVSSGRASRPPFIQLLPRKVVEAVVAHNMVRASAVLAKSVLCLLQGIEACCFGAPPIARANALLLAINDVAKMHCEVWLLCLKLRACALELLQAAAIPPAHWPELQVMPKSRHR